MASNPTEIDMSKDDKIVKDIIKRYGETLDLKSSPYVIVEIIRQYGPKLGGVAASCQPPGGPPKVLDPSHIIKELKAKAAELIRLSGILDKALKTKAAGKTKPKGK
jgi:hypothetical protein